MQSFEGDGRTAATRPELTFELRAAVMRRHRDPRALLEPILAAIEGGETTRDVRDARALLAELPIFDSL